MPTSLYHIMDELTSVRLYGMTPVEDVRIDELCSDSRRAKENCLFICIKGFVSDGHAFAQDAYARGCRCFLAEHELSLPEDACQLLVPDTRVAQAEAAAVFWGHPERQLYLVGITGTKGKTTTALFLQKILCDGGIPTGYMGTNGIAFADKRVPTVNSTPDSLLIYAYLREMLDAGITAAVMEVSSQGLKLHRVHGLRFHACVFTNLSPDHIGGNEHPDFEDYKTCKHSLFTEYDHCFTVCNMDDPATTFMNSGDEARVIGISTHRSPKAEWQIEVMQGVVRNGIPGMEYALSCRGKADPQMYFLPQPGEFNVKNALCAIAVAHDAFRVPVEVACTSLETAVIPGRFETVFYRHVLYVIDYAHNGVSLSSMLDLLRGYHPSRVICLFGSVGERTKERRRELAEAAGGRADLCILTSDNPGKEDPWEILHQINDAFPDGSCSRVMIPQREAAIAHAVRCAQPGDVVLLAGKGHETYQLIGAEKRPYSERAVLMAELEKQFETYE